jgi:Putative prokaryotic signal transducing protein
MVDADDDDWVEIGRFDDRIGAEMIRDFLADHDVRVALHGNPQATRMTWSQTSDVIRIVVPRADLENAKEALEAMTAGEQHPFRGPTPAREDDEDEARGATIEKPRSASSALALAIIVPIGAGHFYARHGAAGIILCAGMLGAFLASIVGGQPAFLRAWGILVVVDAIGAFFAARRYNQRRVPPEGMQRTWAMAAVVLAFAGAWLLAR